MSTSDVDDREGLLLELTIGAVAHGGHCVARHDSGQVVFVRHALPGERVRAVVTEARTGYLRADAVDLVVLDPPRSGAGRDIISAIADRSPRAVAYVACDPGALPGCAHVPGPGLAPGHAALLRPVPDDPSRGERGSVHARLIGTDWTNMGRRYGWTAEALNVSGCQATTTVQRSAGSSRVHSGRMAVQTAGRS